MGAESFGPQGQAESDSKCSQCAAGYSFQGERWPDIGHTHDCAFYFPAVGWRYLDSGTWRYQSIGVLGTHVERQFHGWCGTYRGSPNGD